jgi:hypothetical protein
VALKICILCRSHFKNSKPFTPGNLLFTDAQSSHKIHLRDTLQKLPLVLHFSHGCISTRSWDQDVWNHQYIEWTLHAMRDVSISNWCCCLFVWEGLLILNLWIGSCVLFLDCSQPLTTTSWRWVFPWTTLWYKGLILGKTYIWRIYLGDGDLKILTCLYWCSFCYHGGINSLRSHLVATLWGFTN